MYTKKQASAFAVTALLAYVISAIENATGITKSLVFTLPGQNQPLNLPGVEYVVILLLSPIAIRLYFHAWSIDECFLIIRLKETVNLPISLSRIEFVIRIIWLMLTMYFPTVLAKGKVSFLHLNITWEVYLLAIFLLIVIWDFLLKNYVIKLANTDGESRKSDLHWVWIISDIGLLVFSAVNIIALNFVVTDWKWIIFFAMLGFIVAICATQVVYFFTDIKNHKIKFEIQKTA